MIATTNPMQRTITRETTITVEADANVHGARAGLRHKPQTTVDLLLSLGGLLLHSAARSCSCGVAPSVRSQAVLRSIARWSPRVRGVISAIRSAVGTIGHTSENSSRRDAHDTTKNTHALETSAQGGTLAAQTREQTRPSATPPFRVVIPQQRRRGRCVVRHRWIPVGSQAVLTSDVPVVRFPGAFRSTRDPPPHHGSESERARGRGPVVALAELSHRSAAAVLSSAPLRVAESESRATPRSCARGRLCARCSVQPVSSRCASL